MAFDEEHPFLHPDLNPLPAKKHLTLGQKWQRKAFRELVPLVWGENCCTSEWYTAVADIFGHALVYPGETWAPAQADLLIITGHVTEKAVPALRAIIDAMPLPHFVIAAGACSQLGERNAKAKDKNEAGPSAGAPLAKLGRALADIVPVDVVIPGCPPTPQAFAQGIMLLQKMIMAGYRGQGIWQ